MYKKKKKEQEGKILIQCFYVRFNELYYEMNNFDGSFIWTILYRPPLGVDVVFRMGRF